MTEKLDDLILDLVQDRFSQAERSQGTKPIEEDSETMQMKIEFNEILDGLLMIADEPSAPGGSFSVSVMERLPRRPSRWFNSICDAIAGLGLSTASIVLVVAIAVNLFSSVPKHDFSGPPRSSDGVYTFSEANFDSPWFRRPLGMIFRFCDGPYVPILIVTFSALAMVCFRSKRKGRRDRIAGWFLLGLAVHLFALRIFVVLFFRPYLGPGPVGIFYEGLVFSLAWSIAFWRVRKRNG